jgi:hypothetical protein
MAIRGGKRREYRPIWAYTSPAAGDCGLDVVYNTSVAFGNRTVRAALAVPGGKLTLYIDP